MPVAAYIAALPAHASPGMVEARGSRGSADASSAVSGTDSGQEFGRLFREQAGEQAGPLPVAAKGGGNADLPMPGSPLENGAAGPASLPSGQPSTDQQQAVPGAVAAPDSAEAVLHAQLQSDLRAAATGGASAGSAESPNADSDAAIAKRADDGASRGFADGKTIGPSSSADTARPQRKTKDETATVKQNTQTASAHVLPELPAIAAAPVASPVPAMPRDGAAKTNEPLAAASAQKGGPAQGASANGGAASVSGKDQSDAGDQSGSPDALSAGALKSPALKGGGATNDASGDPSREPLKGSADSISAAQHGALAQHTVGAASAVAPSSAAPAPGHIADAGASASTAQRVDQPGSAAPAIVPGASSASGTLPNAYDRIDQGAAPVVLHSGSQHVSVGVQDPNLGWVEIKTQNLAGHVDATLVTASSQSHDALAAQLPAMAQFLEQRDVRVGALAVHHEMPGGQNSGQNNSSGNPSGNGAGNGAGTGAGNGGGAHSGHSGSGEGRARYTGLSPGSLRPAAVSGAGANDDSGFRPISYISVRA